MPFFDAAAQGRVLRAYLEPQPDDQVPRFDFETHLADLTASPPRWPESTRRISQLRIALEYEPQKFWKRQLGYDRLNIDIVDYPGEWLLDLPLLRLDYRDWSDAALAQSRAGERKRAAQEWHAALAATDPAAPADEAVAAAALLIVQGLFAGDARRSQRAVDFAAGALPDAGRARRLAGADLRAARAQGRGKLSARLAVGDDGAAL